ncbi:MAG: type IV pilus modification PilV family protein [Gemmatimonadales bacterium]
MTTRAQMRRPDDGFSLVEVLVSMTILSIASLAMGTLMFRAARVAGATADASYQTAALSAEAGRLSTAPFESLVIGTSCATVTVPPFPHDVCSTINDISPKVRRITIVVTPSGNSLLRPATTSFNRTISGNGNPLNTP